MIKWTTFITKAEDGSSYIHILNGDLEKTASYRPELQEFIGTFEKKAGCTYVLVNAMTAGEYFGPNYNGDHFPEPQLQTYHKTFEKNAYAYRHHQNKDPLKSAGKVIFSTYNPEMHRVELIIELENDKAQDILERLNKGELPAVSMGCFLPGTPVVNDNFTTTEIQDIKVDDYVLTHTGNLQRVYEVHERIYKGEMFIINPTGTYLNEIHATREHPWFVVDPEKFFIKDKRSRLIRNSNLTLDDAVWKTSEELTGDELLVIPTPKTVSINKTVTTKTAKLLGWYLAEGHTSKDRNSVIWSTCETDQITREFADCISEYPYSTYTKRRTNHTKTGLVIEVFGAKELKEICLNYCGKYAHLKKLHKDIFSWDRVSKLEFIGSYLSGDGYFYNDNVVASSCSKPLLEQLQWLGRSVGVFSTIYKNEHKAGSGKSVSATTEWVLRFRKTASKILQPYCDKINLVKENYGTGAGPIAYKDFSLIHIESINSYYYEGPVYNLEVENDNSYVVGNFAVHNCRTPSDRCSICGNRSKNTANYCDHLKYQMRHTLPDGRRIYAINDDRLNFFDISFVRVPADKTASVITKVAHVQNDVQEITIPSATIGEEWLKRSGIKESTLFKEVPGTIEGLSPDPKGLILASQKRIPKDELDKVASEFSLKDILSTLLGLRIMPRPEEFIRIVLISSRRPNLIDRANQALGHERQLLDLGEDPLIPVDVNLSGFNQELANRIQTWVPGMSLTKPLIMQRVLEKRVELEKEAYQLPTNLHENFLSGKEYAQVPVPKQNGPLMSTENPSPVKNPLLPMAGLGALWYGFNKVFNGPIDKTKFSDLVLNSKNGWAYLTLLLGATGFAAMQAQKQMFHKQAGMNADLPIRVAIGLPASYILAGHEENKLQKGEQLNTLQNIVRKHPFLTGATGIGAFEAAKHFIKKANWDRIILGLTPEKLDELYNDIIGNTNLDIN